MYIRTPSYYKDFLCKADKCRHSCCVGWALEIDSETYEYYKTIEGPFGRRLRESMENARQFDEDGNTMFSLEVGGTCPFLNREGLCDIVKELGEEALCDVCATYPRSSFTYGDTTELFLTLSCEEAVRLHFRDREPVTYITEKDDHTKIQPPRKNPSHSFEGYPKLRDDLVRIIQQQDKPLPFRLSIVASRALRGQNINPEKLLECKCLTNLRDCIHTLQSMTSLNEDWDSLLDILVSYAARDTYKDAVDAYRELKKKDDIYNFYEERILLYYITRYMPSAIYDGDYKLHLLFAMFCLSTIMDLFAVFHHLYNRLTEEDMQSIICIFSRQVEHSEENIERIHEELLFQ